jgi:hypothetical protein
MKAKVFILSAVFMLLLHVQPAQAAPRSCAETGITNINPFGNLVFVDLVWSWNSVTADGFSSPACCDFAAGPWSLFVYENGGLIDIISQFYSFPQPICLTAIPPSCCGCNFFGGNVQPCF